MRYLIHGNTFIVVFYTAVIISALDYYLIGRETAPVLHKFLTDMPAKFEVAGGPCELCGCVFDVDPAARLCRAASPVRLAAP